MAATETQSYVRHDADRLRSAILVSATNELELEKPVQAEASPIAERARQQHEILVRTLQYFGVETTVLEPAAKSGGGSVFAGECAVVLPSGVVMMRPASARRRKGLAQIEDAVHKLGVPLLGRIEPPGLLDGADAIVAGDTVYIGAGAHSNAAGRDQLRQFARAAGLEAVELAIASDALHLRNVCSFVTSDRALVAAEKFEVEKLRGVRRLDVVRGEEWAAGVLTLAPGRVLTNLRWRDTGPALRKAKVAVEAIDLWEFGKIGASPSSLVLALKRG